jgi:hypothetical protein
VTVYQYEYGLLKTPTRAPGTSSQAVRRYKDEPGPLGLATVTDPRTHTTSRTYDVRVATSARRTP